MPVDTKEGHIYVNAKGYPVKRLSHSQYSEYRESPAKYKWKRLFGYEERVEGAAPRFGDDIQSSVRAFYESRKDPIEVFTKLWEQRKDAVLDYGQDNWAGFLADGQGLMAELVRRRAEFPISNPRWFDWKDKYVPTVKDDATGCEFVSIPDLMDKDDNGPILVDIKALYKPLRCDTAGIVGLDTQLRTQAAVMGVYRVALWVFVRSPQRPPAITKEQISATVFEVFNGTSSPEIVNQVGIYAYREVNGGTYAEVAEIVGFTEDAKLRKQIFKDRPALKDDVDARCAALCSKQKPQYRIQWLETRITPEHAQEAIRDELSVIPQIQAGWFPCRCGVRWPNDNGPRCAFRGLCLTERIPDAPQEWKDQWAEITASELKQATDAEVEF